MLLSAAATSCGCPIARELLVCARSYSDERLVEPILAVEDVARRCCRAAPGPAGSRGARRWSAPARAEANASSYRPREIRLCSAPLSVRATSTSRPTPAKQRHRGVVVLQRVAVFPAAERDVTQRPAGSAPREPSSSSLSATHVAALRQPLGLLQVGPREPHDVRRTAARRRRGPRARDAAQKARARRGGRAAAPAARSARPAVRCSAGRPPRSPPFRAPAGDASGSGRG